MILVVKSCGSKVDQPDLWIKKDLAMPCCAVDRCRRRRYCAVICKCLVGVLHQEDVLGLKIGVDEVQVVQESNAGEQLLGEFLDV